MKQLIAATTRLVDLLGNASGLVVGAVYLFIMLSVTVAVFMRYVFRQPLGEVVNLSGIMLLIGVALSLAYTQKVKGHVRVDLLILRISGKKRLIIDILALLATLAYAVMLFWTSLGSLQEAFKGDYRDTSLVWLRLTPVYLLLVIGVVLLCLQLLVQIGRDIGTLVGRSRVKAQ